MKLQYAERMALDRVSTLPQPILETILCLLPTEEAARTSILSREWRYKWTKIPILEFNLRKRTSELTSDISSTIKYIDMHDLHQVLLLRQGPIHELTLSMTGNWEDHDCFEFDQIILHLSRNHTVKKLRLDGPGSMLHELPKSVFALHDLEDLDLCDFIVDLPSIFNGFGSLVSLYLNDVKLSTKTLRHLLSNCPSLESLNLDIGESDDKCTIYELLKCLPVIEDLTISIDYCEWLVLDSVPQELPTSLIHLKYIRLDGMSFVEGSRLAFLLVLIRCSPNLERIKLQMALEYNGDQGYGDHEYRAVKDEYSDVWFKRLWLEHLKKLEISLIRSSHVIEFVKDFVKFILVRSPKLKKVSICSVVHRNQESEMLKTLLQAPRASPAVIITTNEY
ncbi:putative leucine-rich repeat domain superfamily, F-box-like domain superfamily [Helianthus annuus]|uniref:Leucine-rich repeat domain superfamily, F-box-like domain superfamily n=1 Tax=Helianthus annuus TaxID=4232 RepID=A0A251RWS6_HELAN|nr:F-box/FBD/LRR-repeat protein At1g13570 isoform X1 [Helianthus annuus]KAF5758363.1 putative leucine-rich repeat domain superfamily, F-box-like domain superfamily [Helianthus annuus]KAJ0436718.1 putative leucine-rich repeat domain superfamily, F-box-like domain superfamily [Helianthus annuus]KAJ0440939.1 putative leucine-rich repeat domain superfamily, F-box-like domain superfamily [Helianthus annuus]KAJ0459016.1 putative leucine-rich repeat domain superfamily, F-box-like domain superfamily [H